MDDYGNECKEAVAELRAQLAAAQAAMLAFAQPCVWTLEERGEWWDAACGRSWVIEGTPGDNEFAFCPGCGHPLTWSREPLWTPAERAAADAKAAKLLAPVLDAAARLA